MTEFLRLRRDELLLLAGVLLVAAGLRLWGIFFGLPHVYHPDEGFEVYRALRLGTGSFDFDRIAKGGYYFLLFAEYAVYFLGLFVTGAVTGAAEFAERFAQDPSPFWRIGRVTTALLGTATVFLVWFQAKRMGSGRAGLLAAWFLALSFRHVVDSHFITVDVPMTLFAFLAVVLVVEDVSGRRRLRLWEFALVSAFAALNKMPAVLVFLPYFLGAYLRGGWRGQRGVWTLSTWLTPIVAGVIYLAANPGFLTNLDFVMRLVGDTVVPGGEPDAMVGSADVETPNLWWFYLSALVQSQGPALLALSLIGAILGLTRRSQAVVLHLAFIVPFFVLIAGASSSHLYYSRYITPLLPSLCLLSGLALDDMVRRIRGPSALATGVVVATALVIVLEPGRAAVRWDAHRSRTDTRTEALNWIESNVEHRSRVLLEGNVEETSQLTVPLRNTKKNVKDMIDRLQTTDPGKAMFWELKIETLEKPLYDLVAVRHFEPWGSLEEYRARDVQYVVLRRDNFVRGAQQDRKHESEIVESRYAFYDELRTSGARLVSRFEASPDGLPGYDLEVWRLPPAETARVLEES